jgi:uncharacterized protein
MTKITASKLYDYLQCKHKVWRDLWGPQEEKNPEPNPFVELLWERGVKHEEEVVKKLGDFVNVDQFPINTRVAKTLELMKAKTPLIYHGVIEFGNLSGIPDLLKLNGDGTYTPIDIKSGRGYENAGEDEDEDGDEKKPKKHYAAQLALYLEILRNLGFSTKWEGYIYDIDNHEVLYQLMTPRGVKNKQLWVNYYQELKEEIKPLLENKKQNKPALGGKCKLCPWYQSCTKKLKEGSDPTLLFNLGRSKRDALLEDLDVRKVEDLLNLDIPKLMLAKSKDKKFLPGLAFSTLTSLKKRAEVFVKVKKPVIYQTFDFPQKLFELFFDIEDDPTQGFVYLHGVYERSKSGERFLDFTAIEKTKEAEKKAWADFIKYVKGLPADDFCLYHYSHHERTTYKKLREQYPDVITSEELEALFSPQASIDLYSVVVKNTDWPVSSYSLKDLACHLGFEWRDKTPSGALSIEWFNRYLETGDQKDLQRIILYNEDDCKATMILKDALVSLMK